MANGEPTRRLELLSTILTVSTALMVIGWAALTPMELELTSFVPAVTAISVAAALGYFYRVRRPDERLSATCIGLAQLIAFPIVALPLSYLVATLAFPLADATFVRWDEALGLDWKSYHRFVQERPSLSVALAMSYDSLQIQMLLVALLGLLGRAYEMQRFLVAYMMAALISIAISAVLPAISAAPYYGLGALPFAAEASVSEIEALRSGAMTTIVLTSAKGIITFPSMHAALGLFFLVTFWSVRWLRWPAIAINVLMIASTPLDGSHYFVDVIAGLALAVCALVAADALAAPRARQSGSLPAPSPA